MTTIFQIENHQIFYKPKFFGKEATPRQMKDQIMTLLEDWKERQPPELAKPDKKMDMEK